MGEGCFFNILYTKICFGLFFYAALFFSNLKEVQIKIHWNFMFVLEKDKCLASFFFDDNILKFSLLN